MVIRLDVKYRVGPSTNTVTVNYNGGGNQTLTLASALYDSLALLCAQVQTQLQTVHASLTCTESAGTVTIAGTANFTVTWSHVGLRDWLGYAAGLSGANSYVAPAVSPGTFVATQPWDHPQEYGWEWQIKSWRGPHQTGSSWKVGSASVWQTRAMVTRAELTQFRRVLRRMLQGQPARWWRKTTTGTAWSVGNWYGFLDVALHPDLVAYGESFAEETLLLQLFVELRFVEWTP